MTNLRHHFWNCYRMTTNEDISNPFEVTERKTLAAQTIVTPIWTLVQNFNQMAPPLWEGTLLLCNPWTHGFFTSNIASYSRWCYASGDGSTRSVQGGVDLWSMRLTVPDWGRKPSRGETQAVVRIWRLFLSWCSPTSRGCYSWLRFCLGLINVIFQLCTWGIGLEWVLWRLADKSM